MEAITTVIKVGGALVCKKSAIVSVMSEGADFIGRNVVPHLFDDQVVNVVQKVRRKSNSGLMHFPGLKRKTRGKNSLVMPLVDSRSFSTSSSNQKKVLVTGSGGQIGVELIPVLQRRYGAHNVIASDVRKPEGLPVGTDLKYLDVRNKEDMQKLVMEKNVGLIIHNAAMLSAIGEKHPEKALEVNIVGLQNVLQVAKETGVRVFAPSTIAVFGPDTPKEMTPNNTIMRPTTMYGLTKVHLELLGQYYHNKFGVDFRSIRYPGIISSAAEPGGGTTDYAVDIFHHAVKFGKYECFLKPDAALPMMHMKDCIRATMMLMEAPSQRLTQRVYNVTAASFSPAELAVCIQKFLPKFEISYKPDFRQEIAASWPRSIDDTLAQIDFGWKPMYGTEGMTKLMLSDIAKKYRQQRYAASHHFSEEPISAVM